MVHNRPKFANEYTGSPALSPVFQSEAKISTVFPQPALQRILVTEQSHLSWSSISVKFAPPLQELD